MVLVCSIDCTALLGWGSNLGVFGARCREIARDIAKDDINSERTFMYDQLIYTRMKQQKGKT